MGRRGMQHSRRGDSTGYRIGISRFAKLNHIDASPLHATDDLSVTAVYSKIKKSVF